MKRLLYILIAMLVAILGKTMSYAQEANSFVSLYFEVNKHTIDTLFCNNGERMTEFARDLNYIIQNPSQKILSVEIVSSASPEGPFKRNEVLAQERAKAARKYLAQFISVDDSIITIDSRTIDWDRLARMIEEEDAVKADVVNIKKIISTSNDSVSLSQSSKERNAMLQALNGGETWQYMFENLFPEMRNATIIVTYERHAHLLGAPAIQPVEEQPLAVEQIVVAPQIVEPRIKVGSLYVKTNIPAWGLLMSNIGAEYCFSQDRFSVNLHAYYSAIDYFSQVTKFRTFAIFPEFRYYIPGTGRDGYRGLFVGAHAGVAYYNFTLENLDLRYQDHNGTSPAWGGGLSLGYRLPLSQDQKWNLEFVVGAGVYDLYYDTFYNVPNGKLTGTYHETYWGLDNVGITLSYRFDLTKSLIK